jgi:uncharacterized protein YukE
MTDKDPFDGRITHPDSGRQMDDPGDQDPGDYYNPIERPDYQPPPDDYYVPYYPGPETADYDTFRDGVHDIEVYTRWMLAIDPEAIRNHATHWRRVNSMLSEAAEMLKERRGKLAEAWGGEASQVFLDHVDDTHRSSVDWSGGAGNNAALLEGAAGEVEEARRFMFIFANHYYEMVSAWQNRDGDELVVNDPRAPGWTVDVPVVGQEGDPGTIKLTTAGGNPESQMREMYHPVAANVVNLLASQYVDNHYYVDQPPRFRGPTELTPDRGAVTGGPPQASYLPPPSTGGVTPPPTFPPPGFGGFDPGTVAPPPPPPGGGGDIAGGPPVGTLPPPVVTPPGPGLPPPGPGPGGPPIFPGPVMPPGGNIPPVRPPVAPPPPGIRPPTAPPPVRPGPAPIGSLRPPPPPAAPPGGRPPPALSGRPPVPPGGIRPGTVPPGGLRPGAVPPGGVRPGAVPPGGVRPGAVPPGGVRPGAVPPGGVRPGAVPPGGVRPGALPPGARPGTAPAGTRPGAVPPGTRPGAVPPGATPPAGQRPGPAPLGTNRPGPAPLGTVRPGGARPGVTAPTPVRPTQGAPTLPGATAPRPTRPDLRTSIVAAAGRAGRMPGPVPTPPASSVGRTAAPAGGARLSRPSQPVTAQRGGPTLAGAARTGPAATRGPAGGRGPASGADQERRHLAAGQSDEADEPDRDPWAVPRPTGLIQGGGPDQPAAHGKPIEPTG